MSKKQKLINSVIHVLAHNRDGSYRTRADRQQYLIKMANDLYHAGFQLDHIRYLKAKHIWHIVHSWQGQISSGTMKNRLSHIRWLLGKFNQQDRVPANDQLGIQKRQYVTHEDKSRELTPNDLSKIKDPGMQLSLQAQVLFGLRVEESLKIKPFVAGLGEQLFIKGSWSKGGRDRYIPICTQAQRQWLKGAKQWVRFKHRSLISKDTSYKTYRSRFNKACQRAGIYHCHGHRHQYAQQRYYELTGWPCPVKHGPKKTELTKDQLALDQAVRLQISRELGHSRVAITKIYCN